MILHTNKWCVLISDQNLQLFFKSIWKIPQCFGTLAQPFHFLPNTPVMTQYGSSLGPHVLNGYGSMTLATTNTVYGKRDPALVDMWGTSYQNMKYQSTLSRRVITGGSEEAVRVSQRMDCRIGVIKFFVRFRFRFKIALLLPIKHRIIYITIKSTWNVNTSTNTAMHYHGSKGSWKSCGIYGLLVCYTYSKYISTGVQRVQQKKKVTQNDITSNYVSTTHAVHDFNTVQLK